MKVFIKSLKFIVFIVAVIVLTQVWAAGVKLSEKPLPLQTLSDKYGGYLYSSELNPAVTVTVGKTTWSFLGDEDYRVWLIRGTVKFGRFKPDEAYVAEDGKIYIKENLFAKYLDVWNLSNHGYEKNVIKNIARFFGRKWLFTDAADMAARLKFMYGNLDEAYVPEAQAVLSSELEKAVKTHKINITWPFSWYNPNEAIETILKYDDELLNQSRNLGIRKEIICATIFREIISQDILSKSFDYRSRATKGIAQISFDGALENEIIGKADNEFKYSPQKLKEMLKVEKEHIYLAAIALKTRAIIENISPGTTDKDEIIRIFMRYNDAPKSIRSVGSDKYGAQTYEYYTAFKKYYETVDKNRILMKSEEVK